MRPRARQLAARLNTAATAMVACAALSTVLLCAGNVAAQGVAEQTPDELQGVSIEPNMGAQLPLDLVFTDDEGNEVTLGEYFTGDKPVILTPVYYNCPQLCTLVLNGLVDGLKDVEMSAGEEFEIVTFSFAEEETTELASLKKKGYLTLYPRETAPDGWHFLTGSKQSIDELCDTIGFNFKRQDDGVIAHSASIVFITPKGRISTYMNDVVFQPRDLRFALVDASEGTIASAVDQFLLFTCFQYDPQAGSFVPSAWKIMRFFGVLTIIGLGGALLLLFRLDAKKRRSMEHTMQPAVEGGYSS